MGMTYLEYCRTTWAQFVLKARGYHEKMETQDLEQRRIARDIKYMIYLSIPLDKKAQRLSLYEFESLPKDPTKAQIARAEKRQGNKQEKQAEEMIKFYNQAKEQGLI